MASSELEQPHIRKADVHCTGLAQLASSDQASVNDFEAQKYLP